MIKFVTINYTSYEALNDKDPNTIYLIKDKGIIINNSQSFGDKIIKVDTIPVAPTEGVLYILPTLEGYTLLNGTLEKILTPVSNIATQYTLVFNINGPVSTGVQGIPVIVPEDGTIESINAITTITGTEDGKFDIEKMNASDVDTEGAEFSSIFNDSKYIIIPKDKLTNKTATQYELASNTINNGDILRLNVKDTGSTLSGVSLQIKISIK